MESLAPYHPAIVHAPIALIIASVVFELIGRATDLEWWRRAAFAMLLAGVLGAGLAVLSGRGAEEIAEERQGVPREPIEEHEEAAYWTLGLGAAALAARVLAGRMGAARAALAGLALLLQLAAAAAAGMTGYRGGHLVFEYAAGVKLHGRLLKSGPPRQHQVQETAGTGGATAPPRAGATSAEPARGSRVTP